jgi:cell surface protein SprA
VKHLYRTYRLFLFWILVLAGNFAVAQNDSTLKYPIKDTRNKVPGYQNPYSLKDPSSMTTKVTFDPATGKYVVTRYIGNTPIGFPMYFNPEEYQQYKLDQETRKNWSDKSTNNISQFERQSIIPKLALPPVLGGVFGGNFIDIRPNGSAELKFAYQGLRQDNPNLTFAQRKTGNFDFDMNLQLSIQAQIGDKLKFNANQNTQSVFQFENRIKFDFNGKEDDIVKSFEVGNVGLPLRGTLIQGSQTLFGVKSQLQFGRLKVTGVVSNQQGNSQNITVQNGAQVTNFSMAGDEYDANRHFFLNQSFRANFDKALSKLPIIQSPYRITRIEVWVVRRPVDNDPEIRDVLAFADLAENDSTYIANSSYKNSASGANPSNYANGLYQDLLSDTNIRLTNNSLNALRNKFPTLQNSVDFEQITLKKLGPNDFTYHPQLGFISLNQALNNDQVLAVAYEYTYNGQVYRVGEFSNERPTEPNNPSVLFLKLLKGTQIRVDRPIWDLMMKNIYSLNAYQVAKEDFFLDVVYADLNNGYKRFLPEGAIKGIPLIRVSGLDSLNVQLEPTPDGVFDFIDGLTIDAQKGRIMFPVLEPFGSNLKKKFANTPNEIQQKYLFQELYDSTRAWAVQFPEKNRFYIKGKYKGQSGNEIFLGAINVPEGSVKVTAGNRQLVEGSDYTVDYTLGRVKIINPSVLSSGQPVNVSFENNPGFTPVSRSLIASRFDYMVAKNFNVGGTILRLNERPITPKVNQGDEPIKNTVIGLDANFNKDSRFLTKALDALPLYSTKEKSTITFDGEFAQLFPGNANAISKNGVSYIDDFEGAENSFDIRQPMQWYLASVPSVFPESNLVDSLASNKNRAKIAWHQLDPLFFRETSITPKHIADDKKQRSNHYFREVLEQEVFPNKQLATTQPLFINTFDLRYYPNERGPYNFDASPTPGISYGLNADGTLNNPSSRWAGIQRTITQNDFEAANIEFIEFWMMDPFNAKDGNPNHKGGDFVINLGSVSEDILKDDRHAFEHGNPRNPQANTSMDTTHLGIVPNLRPVVNTFDNDPNSRQYQDIGYDGLNDSSERSFFKNRFLDLVKGILNPAAYDQVSNDPAADNYHHFRGTDYDNAATSIEERYKKFNGPEGNSPTPEQSKESYPTTATNQPNNEDINLDNSLNRIEAYYEYKIKLKPSEMVVGKNYIADKLTTTVTLADGTRSEIIWYQFRVPVMKPQRKVGPVVDFKSIRYLRMYLNGFDEKIAIRFATFQLVRTDWRRYSGKMDSPNEQVPQDDPDNPTNFTLSTVNIEENGYKKPVNYVLPPDIERVQNVLTNNFQQLNEQSIQLKVCNLLDGDARAVFKNTTFDIRAYKRIRMFVHAEGGNLRDKELHAFIRLGNDFTGNYYEYEIPLTVTQPGLYKGEVLDDRIKVWPTENELNVTFEELNNVKLDRNAQHIDKTFPYTIVTSDGKRITVKGNPNLANVQVIMLGIRNPKCNALTPGNDDCGSECGEVWFNELRLTDFDNRSGWAARGTVNVRLADLGTVNVSGFKKSIGYGNVDSKVADRNRLDTKEFDINSQLEMGKFFPTKWRVAAPLSLGFGQSFKTPEYNPLDPDIKMVLLKNFLPKSEVDSIYNIVQDFTQRKNLSLTNLRKSKTTTKSLPWDPSNFDFTYTFSEQKYRNFEKQSDINRQQMGALGYNFVSTAKPYKPFKNVKSEYLKFISDFNILPLPNSFNFRTSMNRSYNELILRNNSDPGSPPLDTLFNKNFTMTRDYNLAYNIAQSIQFQYTANNQSRIDEPLGRIDQKWEKDSIMGNILNGGRTTGFNQNVNLNYNLPFNKFPFLDFINATAGYRTTYNWQTATLAAPNLGNTISNSSTQQGNAQLNFVQLYNKVNFLQLINNDQPFPWAQKMMKEKEAEDALKGATKKDSTKIQPPKKKAKNVFGEDLEDETDVESVDNSSPKRTGEKAGEEKKQRREPVSVSIMRYSVRAMMMVRNASFNYTYTTGTIIPGFNQKPQLLGNNLITDAPGWGFVFGEQSDMRNRLASNQWLVKDSFLTSFYQQTRNLNLNARAVVEPFKDFRIELNATRNESYQLQDNFKYDFLNSQYRSYNPVESGNFSISTITLKSAFDKIDRDPTSPTYLKSDTYDKFTQYRQSVSNQLGIINPNSGGIDSLGYALGYSGKSPSVLIPSFLAAYTGKDANGLNSGAFPSIPLPNWRVSYSINGKKGKLSKVLQSLTIQHSYSSTYSANNYISNLLYRPGTNGAPLGKDSITGDFIPKYQMGNITLNEQLQPLIGLDFTLKNGLTARFEYRKSRIVNLSLLNNRISQQNTSDITIGVGFKIAGDKLPIMMNGKKLTNNLDCRFDLSIRDNNTIIRDIDAPATPSAGMKVVSIRPNINYIINDKVTLRVFYDRVGNIPFTAQSYPSANVNAGFSLRFTLTQ